MQGERHTTLSREAAKERGLGETVGSSHRSRIGDTQEIQDYYHQNQSIELLGKYQRF